MQGKPLKPGQFTSVDGILYRVKARTRGCKGCVFNFRTCPNTPVANERRELRIDCLTNWVILCKP